MREYQQKKRFKKIVYSTWSLFFLFVILAALVFSIVKVYGRSRGASLMNEESKKRLEKLQERNARLKDDISRLKSEAGAEEEIRKRFNVAMPGEKLVIIVDKKGENGKMSEEGKDKGFWRKIWSGVKSIF